MYVAQSIRSQDPIAVFKDKKTLKGWLKKREGKRKSPLLIFVLPLGGRKAKKKVLLPEELVEREPRYLGRVHRHGNWGRD
jgi:hypothetical protein